jgi:hypothetical protein
LRKHWPEVYVNAAIICSKLKNHSKEKKEKERAIEKGRQPRGNTVTPNRDGKIL